MSSATVYVNGSPIGTTMTTTTGTFTTTTVYHRYDGSVGSTTTSYGDWITFAPAMTDWPADDIIAYYAEQLAKRRPA